MALTKVRLPVADIEQISNGNSNVDIASSGGDINAVVAGVTVGTFNATGLDLGALTLAARIISARDVNLLNGTVATQLHSDATEGVLGTTSAHPLSIIANNVEAFLVETDGQVQLGVEGTATNHLVTKSYVDANAGVAASGFVANTSVNGSLTIPNSTGNDLIINWGITNSINEASGAVAVVFDKAFPNSFLHAQVSRNIASNGAEEGVNVAGGSTTGMNIYPSYGISSPVYWLAIGY